MPMPDFPQVHFVEVNLQTTDNPMDNNAVKVVVRRGCMFSGYAHDSYRNEWHHYKVGEDLLYGVHKLPNFITRNLVHGDVNDPYGGLTRAQCFCDPTEATVNGHVPSPPPDRKCIEHHAFNETTQQCEWTMDPKYCAQVITNDNRRQLLEIPKWPTNRKYDQDHWHNDYLHAQHYHIGVTHIVVRQHCFATLHWNRHQYWKTLPTHGYGYHRVATSWATPPLAGHSYGTARFECECIK